jgi:BTB/POZ domain
MFNLLYASLLTSCFRIFKSDLFTFVVGKDRKAIVVHSAAITEHSKVLSALVNNGMAESQTRSATLDDMETDDFIRFCQFAYTGDYSTPPFTEDEIPVTEAEEDSTDTSLPSQELVPEVYALEEAVAEERELPEPGPMPTAESATESAAESVQSCQPLRRKSNKRFSISSTVDRSAKVWTSWGVNVSQVNHQTLKSLQKNFENRKFHLELPREKLLDSCQPLPNTQRNHNFAPVFLAHSRLYVFADKYGIEPLQQIALQKLHQTLVRFELYPERVQDLVELVRYAYSDDHTFSGGTDELRALVAVYMASRIEKLNKSDSFLTLLEDGGVFVRYFWLLVRNAVYV